MNKLTAYLLFFLAILFANNTNAQFNILGDASQTATCNCFDVTPDLDGQRGIVWRTQSFDLSTSFDLTIQLFLGYNNGSRWQGADGMAFIIHNNNNTVGAFGGGFGYAGITPSLGIIIDTFQNDADGDPGSDLDHISLHKNGDRAHGTANELVAAMAAAASGVDVEDSAYHDLRVVWNSGSTTLTVYFDGNLRFSYSDDIVTNIFGGNPIVYWGVSASTGGVSNLQNFCYEFNSQQTVTQDPTMCSPDTAFFKDNSTNFFGIDNVVWDFNDGTTLTGDSVIHVYDTTGLQEVYITVTDNIGCEIYDTAEVKIHSPVLTATVSSDSICEGTTVDFNTTLTPGLIPPCDYSIQLTDFFGANWVGANVNVYVNDVVTYTPGTTNTPGTYALSFDDGDVVQLEYVSSASSDYSNTYRFYDDDGNLLFQDGVEVDASVPTPGIQYTTTVTCPSNTTNYSYEWSPASQFTDNTLEDQQIVPDSTIAYVVSVTDNITGCVVYDTLNVYVEKQLLAGTGRDTTLCINESPFTRDVLLTGPFDTGGDWLNESSDIVTDLFTPASDTGGVFTYFIDQQFCTDPSAAITITIQASQTPGISTDTTDCISQGNIDLFGALDGTPDAGGVWTDSVGNTISNIYDLSTASSYVATYTIIDAVCGDVTSNVSVTVESVPVAGTGRDTLLCVNDADFSRTVLLTGPYDTDGIWLNESSNVVTANFSPPADTGGVFTYFIEGNTCVDASANITITMQPSLSAGISSDSALCVSEGTVDLMAVLDGSPDGGGTWTNSFGSNISNIYDLTTASEYVATYTLFDATCGNIASNVTVTVESLPASGTATDLDICSSADSVRYMSLLSGNYGVGAWINASGDTLREYLDPSIDTAGIFTYEVTGVLCPGSSSTSVTVNIESEPDAGVSNDTLVCSYDSALDLFDVIQGAPDAGGTWTNGGGFAVSNMFNPAADLDEVYTYTISNVICGDYTSNVSVTVSHIENITITSTGTSCKDDSDGTASFESSGGISPYVYLWSTGAVTSGVSGLNQGTYTLTLTDNIACVGIQTITVSEPDSLKYVATASNTHCDYPCDGMIIIDAWGGTAPYALIWSHGGDTASTLCAGSYNSTITDANGCELVTDSIALVSEDTLQANFISEVQEINTYEVLFVDSSIGVPVNFEWVLGNGGVEYGDSLLYEYGDTGNYNITYIVTNIYGCLDTAYGSVTINQLEETLIIPTAISPNGDGYNDYWDIHTINQLNDRQGSYTDVKVWIYNRWGTLIYESNDYHNEWDGKYNGEYLPEGVYYYIAEIEGEQYNGSIDIIK